MNIDERLEALAQSTELLSGMVRELTATVEKHEEWQNKVERSLVAGIEAALQEWRNGR